MRKPNPYDKLAPLTDEQANVLWTLLQSPGVSYAAGVTFVKREFGIETSVSALSRWWEKRAADEAQERALRSSRVATEIGDQVEKTLPRLTAALKAQLVQAAFELTLGGADEKRIKTLMSIVGGIDRAALDTARLTHEINKFKAEQKSKIEAGLEALMEQAKGNPEALALLGKARDLVMPSFTAEAA